ncbi:hypothetical protein SANTM175S_04982 [Streptomyces antimycoticus]
MPHTHHRRPPGRRDKRRPEGHALPHARRKPAKADVHAATPVAQEAVDYLRTQEKTDFADAVNVLIAFATATTPQYGDPALSLHVPVDFRDRVREQATAEGVNLQPIVLEGLKGFLAGEWEPSDPKVSPGTAGTKANMSVRIPPGPGRAGRRDGGGLRP